QANFNAASVELLLDKLNLQQRLIKHQREELANKDQEVIELRQVVGHVPVSTSKLDGGIKSSNVRAMPHRQADSTNSTYHHTAKQATYKGVNSSHTVGNQSVYRNFNDNDFEHQINGHTFDKAIGQETN